MAKTKFTPRGPWQATGMQKLRIPKDDPQKLRIRAEELKLKAGRLATKPTIFSPERNRSKLLARIIRLDGELVSKDRHFTR